jgi:negative regulator of flagellin synthesis FlgM
VSNKISGYNPSEVLTSTLGSGPKLPVSDKAAVGAASTGAPQAATADTVTLTGSAQTLQKLSSVLASTPVVNSAKVATVKQAVQNGSYSVNTGSVADKLLHFDSELN